MKKHILLAFVAILAIGIQGCSVEENLNLENTLKSKSLLSIEQEPCKNCVLIKFSEKIASGDKENISYKIRTTVFENPVFLDNKDISCENIESWIGIKHLLNEMFPIPEHIKSIIPEGVFIAEVLEEEETDDDIELEQNQKFIAYRVSIDEYVFRIYYTIETPNTNC